MVVRSRGLATAATTSSKLRPTPPKKTSRAEQRKYEFYDLILRTPSHPVHPIEASLMSAKQLEKLKLATKTRFEGNYSIDTSMTPEERIRVVFGGRIKGEDRQSSSRVERGESRVIAGVTVPSRPPEPDNCCMSGCINCVWELFEEDLKEWSEKREEAASKLVAAGPAGGRWPEHFHAPLKLLDRAHYPESLKDKSDDELFGGAKGHQGSSKAEEDEKWGDVPVSIRVFAATEKRLKLKHKQDEGAQP
ncbi:uncharacterized protein LODBEIA_P48560 [Lodderomyces beijingensis]|uniref:Oxidoreductase-like domain-containing protein n=1 Tax=Lodderomyces beijingensis TaxID=1775926 RepID=A0ABP0ZR81_9ASCO